MLSNILNILDLRTAYGAAVVSLLDPFDNAVWVEHVHGVAFQRRHLVVHLVLLQANVACVISLVLRIVGALLETANDGRNLTLLHVRPPIYIADVDQEQWHANDRNYEHYQAEGAEEKEDYHPNERGLRVLVLLAVVRRWEVQGEAVYSPRGREQILYKESEYPEAQNPIIANSDHPNQIEVNDSLAVRDEEEDLDPPDDGDAALVVTQPVVLQDPLKEGENDHVANKLQRDFPCDVIDLATPCSSKVLLLEGAAQWVSHPLHFIHLALSFDSEQGRILIVDVLIFIEFQVGRARLGDVHLVPIELLGQESICLLLVCCWSTPVHCKYFLI